MREVTSGGWGHRSGVSAPRRVGVQDTPRYVFPTSVTPLKDEDLPKDYPAKFRA